MTIDQLITELQRLKEEGVSVDTRVYLNATKKDALLTEVIVQEDNVTWIQLCN